MKKIYLIPIIILLLVLPLVVAQTELTFPFNKQFDIKRPCFNNGTFCGTSANCSLTLIRDDGSIVVNNKGMTNQGTFHNYTILRTQNNKLGFLPAIMSCCDGTLCGEDTFDISITGNGLPWQVFPQQFFFIIISFILIALGFWFDGMRMFKYVGSMMLMILGIITLYPGYAFINYSTLLGKGVGISTIGLGFYFLIEDSFSRDSQQEYYDQSSERSDQE